VIITKNYQKVLKTKLPKTNPNPNPNPNLNPKPNPNSKPLILNHLKLLRVRVSFW